MTRDTLSQIIEELDEDARLLFALVEVGRLRRAADGLADDEHGEERWVVSEQAATPLRRMAADGGGAARYGTDSALAVEGGVGAVWIRLDPTTDGFALAHLWRDELADRDEVELILEEQTPVPRTHVLTLPAGALSTQGWLALRLDVPLSARARLG